MTLKEALNPLLMLDGLVTLAVLADDGLPVEVIGYDNSDAFAAELATVAKVARQGFKSLELGAAESRVCVLRGPRSVYRAARKPRARRGLRGKGQRGGGADDRQDEGATPERFRSDV